MTEAILIGARGKNDMDGKIRTFTGLYVNPLDMRQEDFRIEDIAHHLALEPRYCGASPYHYSVAQHSVLTSYAVVPPGGMRAWEADMLRFACLMHDAGEYVFKDIPSPVKHDPRMAWYRDAERECTLRIFDWCGIPRALLDLTKPADDEMFRLESRTWWGSEQYPSVRPCTTGEAELRFLMRYRDIRRRLANL